MKPSDLLPEYPRTMHLPYKANVQKEDSVALIGEVKDIFTSEHVYVEEKIDGANSGMILYEDNPIIRNRSRFLSKGRNKRSTAAVQFSRIWNWFYENKYKFELLNEIAGAPVGVYGEWLYALHGIKYDKLPDLFVPFDIYDHEAGYYLDTKKTRSMLKEAGFPLVPLLHEGAIDSFEQLEKLCNEQSPFASEKREGIYIKVSDGKKVINRFKMLREGFVQGCNWSDSKITKNTVLNEVQQD